MKDLNLTRTIPISSASLLLLSACGGRALDGGLPEGDANTDPYSDAEFDKTLEEVFEDFCEKQNECGYYNDLRSCPAYYADFLDDYFDLDSRNCRELAVEAFGCLGNIRGCEDPAYACEDEVTDLVVDCAENSDFYDYYDY